ncbi:hypothetical protein C4578_04295 [Candidatus Microgenomates bacterium]|jgi:hypothetical protein|nr:MAG: hypothetical protein C4578_04295 [Candidatus Microgenomates bacterium]
MTRFAVEVIGFFEFLLYFLAYLFLGIGPIYLGLGAGGALAGGESGIGAALLAVLCLEWLVMRFLSRKAKTGGLSGFVVSNWPLIGLPLALFVFLVGV